MRHDLGEGYNGVNIAIGQDIREHIFVEIVEEHRSHRHSMAGIYWACCTAFDSFQCSQINAQYFV
jgi:hypothetical protein